MTIPKLQRIKLSDMKNKKFCTLLTLLLMAVGVTMQAQETKEYYPLIPESGKRQWDMRFDYYYGDSQCEIGKLGDEIEFEGQTYRELTILYDNLNYTVLYGLLREENKKVYLRCWSPGLQHFMEEELYYDFNLQIGDLFEVGHGDEPEYIQLMAIEEVVLEDGTVRNKFVFDIGWEEDPEVWIEGIGSLAGIDWRYVPGWTASGFSHLQCYFEDDDLVWTEGECWDDVEENAVESVGLYPNPASDIVRVEGIIAAEVQVYNALGQLVKTVRGTNEIDVEELPQGLYLLRIDAKDRQVVKQIVVE